MSYDPVRGARGQITSTPIFSPHILRFSAPLPTASTPRIISASLCFPFRHISPPRSAESYLTFLAD